jgi:hypothetical protein
MDMEHIDYQVFRKKYIVWIFNVDEINVFWPKFDFSLWFDVFYKSKFMFVLLFFIDYMSYSTSYSGIFSDRSTDWWDKVLTILDHMFLDVYHLSRSGTCNGCSHD